MNRTQKTERRKHGSLILAIAFVSLASLSIAWGQLPTATILGVVKDSSGAVIPGATMTARNVDTGQTRTTVSEADGSYRFQALPVGSYEVRVEHPGFQSQLHSGLNLTVSQEVVVPFTLVVGAVEQTVAVTAEAPLVNTTSGSLGGLVSEKQIADLPLNGRNYIDLTLMQAGVSRDPASGSGGAMMRGMWFSSNGAGGRSNNYLLDGAQMSNFNGNSSGTVTDSTLGVEGIREYRVVTNFFSAEYGMKMGSQTIIVSKSGSNSFHGSAFEFFRNSALDARNFFDYKTETSKRRLPAFVQNNYGASFGGPIKKDKTFFFAVYEAVRARTGKTLVTNVFAASAKVDGGAGGVAQISPLIKPFLSYFPDPNLPNNRYTFPFNQPDDENYGQLRADHSFSGNDNMFARYTVQDSRLTLPGNYPTFPEDRSSRPQFGTLSESHIFSPTLLNTFRFSFSRTNDTGISPSPLIGPQFSFMPGLAAGTFSIGGISSFGPSNVDPLVAKQNVFTWSDDLFGTTGRHSLKYGFISNHFQQFKANSSAIRGQITFPSIQSFLQAQPSQYLAVTPGSRLDRTFHSTTLGFYLQDDFRATQRLTLNLGLRYEFSTVPRETHGVESNLRDIQHDVATTVGPFFENPTLRNWSPRFGFAWDVSGSGKTAVRGGFGLLYDLGTLNAALANSLMPPFASQSSVTNNPPLTLPLSFPASSAGKQVRAVDYHMQQTHILQYNVAIERQLPVDMVATVAYAGSRGLNLVVDMDGNPTVPGGIPNGANCVPRPAGQALVLDGPKCWLGNDPRTNPNWGSSELRAGAGNSWYNSLQFSLVKRFSHGLQFQSSYTWSKVLDETQGQIVGESSTPPQDPSNLKRDKAPAGFDITQNWRFNAMYRIPGTSVSSGVLGKVANGWSVSAILSLQDGYPINLLLQANRSRSNNNTGFTGTTDRPDLLPGKTVKGLILGGPDKYFDPSAFAVPPIGFLGNAGRNILRGPGMANLDLSLVKDTPIRALGESGALQFRAEFFNILNRANFRPPGGATGDVLFAGSRDGEAPLATGTRITSTITNSRQIQLALKLVF